MRLTLRVGAGGRAAREGFDRLNREGGRALVGSRAPRRIAAEKRLQILRRRRVAQAREGGGGRKLQREIVRSKQRPQPFDGRRRVQFAQGVGRGGFDVGVRIIK